MKAGCVNKGVKLVHFNEGGWKSIEGGQRELYVYTRSSVGL